MDATINITGSKVVMKRYVDGKVVEELEVQIHEIAKTLDKWKNMQT